MKKNDIEKLRGYIERAQARGEFEWLDANDLINWLTNKKQTSRRKEKELETLEHYVKRVHMSIDMLDDLFRTYYKKDGKEDES